MKSSISRRSFLSAACSLEVPVGGRAQARQPPDRALLIRNVRLFDGMSASLRDGHLLVIGKKIAEVSSGAVQPPQGAQIIDGGHRVLMAGLSDAHWHMVFALNTLSDMETRTPA